MGQHPDQRGDAPDVGLQDRLLLGQDGLAGDVGGHVRIAVAVAADPAAKADHRGHVDAVKIRVIVIGALDGTLEAAVYDRDGIEQRTLEVVHAHADLVPNIGPRGAHLVGLPQCLDVGAQPACVDLAVIDRCRRRIECVDGLEDAPHLQHDRAPLRLGRMGREDRHVADFLEQVLQFIRRDTLFAQFAQARVERALPQHAAFRRDMATLAMLVAFLGGVDELEVDAERADDRTQRIG